MKYSTLSSLLASVFLVIILSACSKPSPDTVSPVLEAAPVVGPVSEEEAKPASPADIDLSKKSPKMISAFNFFKDPAKQIPNDGVIPYALNNQHFADYASVRRFFWVPEGEQIKYSAEGILEMPMGTIILQTFSFADESVEGGERLIETRLIMNSGDIDGWTFTVYKWNAEMTDAKRAVAGGLVQVKDVKDPTATEPLNYLIPNASECSRCHENNEGYRNPIGINARNLSLEVDGKNQLALWAEKGILNAAPKSYHSAVVWDDPASGTIEKRSREWLDANCAHCHNPNGPASVSGLDLSITQTNPMSIGMYKPPVAAGLGSEGFKFSIDPGSAGTSFIINRLQSDNPAVMMPPLGRLRENEEAVQLISEWINSIEFSEEEAQDLMGEQKKRAQQLLESGAVVDQ